jgi:hypothetical protein
MPSYSFSYDQLSNTVTLSFSGPLPDGNYTARAIASGITNASGTPMAADHVLSFFALAGDANHDRAVNIADLGTLATNWQQSPRTFSQGDFNYDGTVNISDLGILATKWQVTLPASRGAAGRISGGQSIIRQAAPQTLRDSICAGKRITHGQELLAELEALATT